MTTLNTAAPAIEFDEFYRDHFLAEHRHPANIACHVVGTIGSAGLIGAALTIISPWWALLYPIAHIGPGLIGHRLFERDADVGDARVLRNDFPGHWFVRANHRMALRLIVLWRR